MFLMVPHLKYELEFQCFVNSIWGTNSKCVFFPLTAHFFEVKLQPDDEVVLEKGSSFNLSCQASGCPQPKFSWKNLSNMKILRRFKTDGFQSQLVFDLVDLEDEGTYLCEVTCGSIKKSKQTEVKVFCKYLERFTFWSRVCAKIVCIGKRSSSIILTLNSGHQDRLFCRV